MLTLDQNERYARHLMLEGVGEEGQKKLVAGSVLVIGAGGLGSPALFYLVAAGVGRVGAVDSDRVELSNLQRQPLYGGDQIGERKVDLAARFIGKRNPHVECRTVADRIERDNADVILSDHDLIIDGTDNFATRLVISDTAVRLGIPLISAAAQQFQGQVALFHGKPCYRCFVGDAFDADDCDTCSELGVLGALTGTVGSFAALLAIRAIVGITPDTAGTLHLFDGLSLGWRQIRIAADPGCKACSSTSSS